MVRRATSSGPSGGAQETGASTVARKPIGSQTVAQPFSLTGVQRKVTVGSPGEAAEHEADRVAEHVASGPSNAKPAISRLETMERPSGTASIYFKLHHRTQSPSDNELNHSVRRKPAAEGEPGGDLDAAAAQAVGAKDPGSPLRPQVLRTLESRMGVDLGAVRVHEGSSAQRSADAMNARAFAHRNDIWLGRGESQEDMRLLAHEATHVVQQVAPPPVTAEARPAQSVERPLAPAAMPAAAAEGGHSGAAQTAPAGAGPAAAPTVVAPETLSSGVATPTVAAEGSAAVAARYPGEGPAPSPAGAGEQERAASAKAPASARETKGAAAATAAGEVAAGEGKTRARDPRQAIAPTIGAVKQRARGAQTHPPATEPVSAAEAAGTDLTEAAARTADGQTVANVMAATQKSDEVAPTFKSKLHDTLARAIDSNMKQPTTKDEADAVMTEGARRANDSLGAQLTTSRAAAAGPLQQAIDHPVQPPAAGAAPALKTEQAGPPPAPVSAAPAVPAPLPAEQLDMSSDRAPTEQAMAKNDIDQKQLEEGNDPAFGPTLSAREQAEKHEAGVETRYRASESAERASAHTAVQTALATGVAGIHTARSARFGNVGEQQAATRDQNLAAKNAVTQTIADIKTRTLQEIDKTLAGLEERATQIFEEGLRRAEALYNDAFSEAKGGIGTWLTTWGEDWDKHIEAALRTAKAAYRAEVDRAIDQVADFVEEKLTAAKRCVSDGLHQVETYVSGLDGSVKEFAQAALKEVSGDFQQMVADIDSRADKLIDKLTEQYRASYQRMEAMEEKLRDENKSLWRRVYDATIGLIEKIIAFKDMLLGILGRAASVVVDIIKHPIRFLGNLIDAVATGVNNFVSNIGEHLKQGFMEWLFGAVAATGIQLPKSFDLKGVVSLVLQVLGLTYANFRARAVALLGEKVVAAIETVAEVFTKLVSEGPGALWEWIKEKVGDLKTMVIDQIQNFIIEKVIMAGVTWLVGLLNPASAFFKACKAIYDIIMFFVERGSQIIALVNAVIDSMASIAAGSIGGAAAMVENALARAIPVVIGFLASLLGVGGISEKIKEVIETVRKPINAAIDWVIGKAVQLVKAAGKFVGGLFGGKEKDKEKKDEGPKEEDPEKAAKVEAGLADVDTLENSVLVRGKLTKAGADSVASQIKERHQVFRSFNVIDSGKTWDYEFEASPVKKKSGLPKAVTFEIVEATSSYTVLRVHGTTELPASSGWRPFESGGRGVIANEILPALYPQGVITDVTQKWKPTKGARLTPERIQQELPQPGQQPVVFHEPRISGEGTGTSKPDVLALAQNQILTFEITLKSKWTLEGKDTASAGEFIHKKQQAAKIMIDAQPALARNPNLSVVVHFVTNAEPDDNARKEMTDLAQGQLGSRIAEIKWLIMPSI